MRSACLTLTLGMLLVSAPAHAQTYDPNYPVCMQIYGPVGYLDCRYTSLPQCRYLAVGRSASCIANPYFPQKKPTAARRSRRVRKIVNRVIHSGSCLRGEDMPLVPAFVRA